MAANSRSFSARALRVLVAHLHALLGRRERETGNARRRTQGESSMPMRTMRNYNGWMRRLDIFNHVMPLKFKLANVIPEKAGIQDAA